MMGLIGGGEGNFPDVDAGADGCARIVPAVPADCVRAGGLRALYQRAGFPAVGPPDRQMHLVAPGK